MSKKVKTSPLPICVLELFEIRSLVKHSDISHPFCIAFKFAWNTRWLNNASLTQHRPSCILWWFGQSYIIYSSSPRNCMVCEAVQKLNSNLWHNRPPLVTTLTYGMGEHSNYIFLCRPCRCANHQRRAQFV